MPFCSQCGSSVPTDGKFCASCGAPIAGQGASTQKPPTPTRQERPRMGSTTFASRFLTNWLAWGLWILFLGISFGAGEFAILAKHGVLAAGFYLFMTNALGYLVGALFLGLIIALLTAVLPALSIRKNGIRIGIITAAVAGLAIGLSSSNYGIVQYMISQSGASHSPSEPQDERAACLRGYSSKQYVAALPSCRAAQVQELPLLQGLSRSHDPSFVATTSWDMLRMTYVMAFAYEQNGKPENARQMALHSVGWGLFALGALGELDPHSSNTEHKSMESEIARDLATLDDAFPGSIVEERKAIQETTH